MIPPSRCVLIVALENCVSIAPEVENQIWTLEQMGARARYAISVYV